MALYKSVYKYKNKDITSPN